MDPTEHAAAIERLRSAIAAGSRDVRRAHIPLMTLLETAGRCAEAVAVALVAADVFWERGLPLQAFAVLNNARRIDRDNPELVAIYERRLGEVDERTRQVVEPDRRASVVMQIRPRIEERYRERIVRCTVHYLEGATSAVGLPIRSLSDCPGPVLVSFSHEGAVPTSWFEEARWLLEVTGANVPIACTATVIDAQRSFHQVVLMPRDDEAHERLCESVRQDALRTMSTIAAVVLDTGSPPPFRVRNIYHDPALATNHPPCDTSHATNH